MRIILKSDNSGFVEICRKFSMLNKAIFCILNIFFKIYGGEKMSIFRKKSIEDLLQNAGSDNHGLKRELGAWDLTMLGIGAIIGTGIFVLTGTGAVNAGPALSLSFVIAGLACLFAALSYAEFASSVPVSGSTYTYAYTTLGEFAAWIIGWDLILEYLLAVSAVSAGWSGYFQSFLNGIGIDLPVVLTAAPGSVEGVLTYMNLPAFLIVMAITLLISRGTKETKRVNNIMVTIKVAVVVLFIIASVFYVKPENWQPFMPFGISGVFSTAPPDVLCFYRIRRGSFGCGRNEESREEPTTWNHWFINYLCRVIYGGEFNHDRCGTVFTLRNCFGSPGFLGFTSGRATLDCRDH